MWANLLVLNDVFDNFFWPARVICDGSEVDGVRPWVTLASLWRVILEVDVRRLWLKFDLRVWRDEVRIGQIILAEDGPCSCQSFETLVIRVEKLAEVNLLSILVRWTEDESKCLYRDIRIGACKENRQAL